MEDGRLSTDDPLTGLPGRAAFIDLVAQACADADADGVGLILLDLKRFASINDALGPRIGDALLGRVARRLSSGITGTVTAGRVSGDGFALLVPRAAGLEGAVLAVMEFCERPFLISGNVINISAHLGAARLGAGIADAYDLLHAADIALHRCIARGERAVFYDPSMKDIASRAYMVERDLRASLVVEHRNLQTRAASDAFRLLYQPKHCARDGRLCGFEALLRWSMADGTPVEPAEFIPIAERTGLIDLIGTWSLHTAARALAAWPAPVSVAVNVAPAQLRNADWLLSNLRECLSETGGDPARLEIEITESALEGDGRACLEEMRAMGLRVWVDDFGTDSSTLARLCALPFTGLKVDKSVTDTMTPQGGGSGDRLVAAVRSIAGALGVETVVEGVEHAWQAERLAALGIDLLQGYHFGRPMEFEAASALVAGGTVQEGHGYGT